MASLPNTTTTTTTKTTTTTLTPSPFITISTYPVSTLPDSNLTCSEDTLPTYTLALTGTSCCLSILGAILIFYTYYKIPEIRNFTRKLLVCLTVADLITALGNFLGTVRYASVSHYEPCFEKAETDELCALQSFMTTFSSMASFWWTVVIAVHIFASVACRSQRLVGKAMFVLYNLLSWGVPGAITLAAAASGYLGEDHSVGTGSWCWIRSSLPRETQVTWMWLSGKAWELFCYLATLLLYGFLKIYLWKERRRLNRLMRLGEFEGLRDEDSSFLYVWLILYCIRMWGTIRFLIAVSRPDIDETNMGINSAQFVLLNLQGIGDSAQASFNAVLFCLCDKTVRRRLRRICCHGNDTELEPFVGPGHRPVNAEGVLA